MDYKQKIITVGDAIKKVKTGSKIVAASFASQPKSFLSFLHTLPKNITNLSIYNVYLLDYPFLQENRFTVYSTFYSGALRVAEKARGNVRYIPAHVSQFPAIYAGVNPDIFVGAASMPKDGKVSLSLANLYDRQSLEAAKTVILEINPNFPYTKGSVEVDLAKVNYIIEADYKPLTIEESALSEKDIIIGNLIAAEIKDGDCLQFGIGAIPDAVANALVKKKHLGIHTEMLTNGALKLILSGAVDNSKKKIGKGKSTTVFACGSQALYDYMHNNDKVEMLDADYVNSPSIIAQNDNQVSINSTIEVDFFGQCASETLGTKHFSGSGGQFDTVQGAKWSKGGRSYIALHSTAKVKNADGSVTEVSKIVPELKSGAAITLPRNEVDIVVTEYGIARLRGVDVVERAKRLIAIAHPDFRNELIEAMKKRWGSAKNIP